MLLEDRAVVTVLELEPDRADVGRVEPGNFTGDALDPVAVDLSEAGRQVSFTLG